ncbi:UNC93-like protein MFSD11 [Caerostris extrusa]|uniref:UNC93-like protein MFSD11 n=1 Tax=Caerostris extrusa TaxID=172846 RepID=A0AAV4Y6B3_CAEEX|nr:UNC93-like protein MFSD11 [Caerostris extrusa]
MLFGQILPSAVKIGVFMISSPLAIVYAVFALSNWLAPSIIIAIGPKVSMLLGGISYSLFIANFFFAETWALYLASTIIGFGASLFWTGQGNFLTINSDSDTMSRNSGVFWALLQCSLLFGNIFVYFKFQGKSEIDKETRFVVFGVLLGVSLAGLALMCCLRSSKRRSVTVTDNSSSSPESSSTVITEFKKAVFLLKTKKMFLLAITFLYTGFELSFFSGVYGTCIGFTKRFGSDAAKYVGISGICIGAGENYGAVFGLLGKKTNKYGRDPVILLGYVFHMVTFFLVFINLPAKAPLHETMQPAFINSSVALAMFCAFGLGFGDACYNTQIYSILGSIYSEDSAPAFALFKFFSQLQLPLPFYSSALELPYQLFILVIFGTLGTFTFWLVEWSEYSKLAKEKAVEAKYKK